jgi:hypothetical protein
MKTKIPFWLLLIIILEALPMFIGPYVALTRPGFMGGPEAEAINQASYIYAARNFSVGFGLLIAWYLRSAPMLFILIFVRLLTDLIDLPTLLTFGLASNPLRVSAIFVFLYYIPAVIALRYLWGQMNGESGTSSPALSPGP